MENFKAIIKTVDGDKHELKFENTTSQDVYWKIFENGDGLLEYVDDASTLYIQADKIVSAKVVNVEKKAALDEKKTQETIDFFNQLNS